MTVKAPALSFNVVRDRVTTKLNQEFILVMALMVLVIATTASNDRFIRTQNLQDILGNASYIAVAAVGMSMVIILGHIDISVGSLIGLLATIAGKLAIEMQANGYPMWIAFVVPLVVGVLIESFNGFLVAYLRIPAIVVTLGMMSILKGGLILWTSGVWIYDVPAEFKIAQKDWLGIPAPIYFMVILTILAALWMRYSDTGRAIYAVGGNREAAHLAGISERRITMTVFMIHGFMIGIAALLFATQFNAIQSTVPSGLEMFIISASVIGGVSILGGVGTVIGSTLGAILLRSINSAMIFADISQYWLQAVQGVLILVTVLTDLLRRRRQSFLMVREQG